MNETLDYVCRPIFLLFTFHFSTSVVIKKVNGRTNQRRAARTPFFALELFVGWNNKALRVFFFFSPDHLLNIFSFGSFALKHVRQGLQGDVLRTEPIIDQGEK